jgi:hypothetical protein
VRRLPNLFGDVLREHTRLFLEDSNRIDSPAQPQSLRRKINRQKDIPLTGLYGMEGPLIPTVGSELSKSGSVSLSKIQEATGTFNIR